MITIRIINSQEFLFISLILFGILIFQSNYVEKLPYTSLYHCKHSRSSYIHICMVHELIRNTIASEVHSKHRNTSNPFCCVMRTHCSVVDAADMASSLPAPPARNQCWYISKTRMYRNQDFSIIFKYKHTTELLHLLSILVLHLGHSHLIHLCHTPGLHSRFLFLFFLFRPPF